jgi:curved DNA-binding protein CbpA
VSIARDPYEVLGVPRTASTRQIRAAYVDRARRAHPDLVGRSGLAVMRALNEAWEILKDGERRAAYDAGRSGGAAATEETPTASKQRRAAGAPPWTGAAGTPPGRPWGPVLDFGIYAGWSLGEIARRDRGYLYWLRERPEARSFQVEIAQLVEPTAEVPPDEKRRR